MIKERALELVAALRSGKYQQTDGELKRGDRFCCLGVACDISGIADWTNGQYLTHNCVLPLAVMDYYGFRTDSGMLSGKEELIDRDDVFIESDNLIDLNDGGATFNEIADIIERRWADL